MRQGRLQGLSVNLVQLFMKIRTVGLMLSQLAHYLPLVATTLLCSGIIQLNNRAAFAAESETHPLFRKFHNRGSLRVVPSPTVYQHNGSRVVATHGDIAFVPDQQKWIPRGDFASHPVPTHCTSDVLEKQLLAAGRNTYQWSRVAGEFFRECESTLTLGNQSKNSVLFAMDSIRYQMQLHPDIREARVRLSDGTEIHGFLALKPNPKPRPLVIVKCGLFCDSQPDSFFKFLTMHLFDESPFHLLILESITAPTFAQHNQRMGVGGVEEGRHIVEVAQILQLRSEISPFISEVHTISPSLGGHAALYASLYNGYHPLPNGRPPLKSVMALCPVVNLENSFADLFTGLKRDFIFTRMVKNVMSLVFPNIDDLRRRYDPEAKMSEKQMQHLLVEANLDFYRTVPEDFFWYPFEQPVNTTAELWERNDFISQAQYLNGTPALVVAANDDWVVRSEHNSHLLDAKGLSGPSSSLNTLHLPYGSHCGFSVSYGWPQMGTLLRSYIFSHSPEFKQLGVWREARIPQLGSLLKANERHMQQVWQIGAQEKNLTLTMKIWRRAESHEPGDLTGSCSNESRRFYTGDNCFRSYKVRIPLRQIGLNFSSPRNEVEAQALTRWANARLRLVGASGAQIVDSKEEPVKVRWQDFAEW